MIECLMCIYESEHEKKNTNKITCVTSEDSDQPGQVFCPVCPHEENLDPKLPIESTVKTDQTESSLDAQVFLLVLLYYGSLISGK